MTFYHKFYSFFIALALMFTHEDRAVFALANDGIPSVEKAKIGFLIPSKKDKHLQNAAMLAVGDANRESGKNVSFELITRYTEGPWGVGSKEAVTLVYEDEVSVIVGALDGRNAHLAEQVTAKNHLVMLSTRSGDPTLSRAYVPWYYRLVPDHRRQAEVIVSDIHRFAKAPSVVILTFDDYDGKKAAEALIKASVDNGHLPPFQNDNTAISGIMELLNKRDPDVVVVAGMYPGAHELLRKINNAGKSWKIYAFLEALMTEGSFEAEQLHEVYTVFPEDFNRARWQALGRAYHEKYGIFPALPLAYVYDGVRLAAEAVRQFGVEANGIRKNFRHLQYKGITGAVSFGKLGDRDGKWEIMKLRNIL